MDRRWHDNCMAILVYLIIVWSSFTYAQQPWVTEMPDYRCPTDCQCSTMPEKPSFAVLMVCSQFGLTNLTLYENIPVRYTTAITFMCHKCTKKNWLMDGAFSHLNELEELGIEAFPLVAPVPRDAFRGLNNLKRLFINTRQYDSVCDPLIFEHEDIFKHTPALEALDFFFSDILEFPTGLLCPLNSLRSLNMSVNCIRDISNLGLTAENCSKSLRLLDLTANILSDIPENLHTILPNLEELYLAFNQGLTIPARTFWLLNMTVLDLEFIKMTTVPSDIFKGQQRLKILRLGGNDIETLPADIFKDLKILEELDLRQNNLRSYDLQHGLLKWLPELRVLNLAGNNLQTVSEEMFRGNIELVSLNLGQNKLVQVEDFSFRQLSNLNTLDLSDNQISDISNHMLAGLRNLQKLDLKSNEIIAIGNAALDDFNNTLTTLNLTNNLLAEFPLAIGKMASLQYLDLLHNRIKELPASRNIHGAKSLVALRISQNSIGAVSRMFFGSKPALTVLNMKHNRIENIPVGTFDGMPRLQYLVLSHNDVRTLSRQFYRNPQLVYVDASHNNLTRVDNTYVPWNIKQFIVSHNRINDIPSFAFRSFPQIIRVDLRFNNIRTLRLNALQISGAKVLTEFLLSGNKFDCTCELTWMKRVNKRTWSLQSKPPVYGTVRDLTSVRCHTILSFSGQTYTGYIHSLAARDLLCRMDSICMKLPCCQDQTGTCMPYQACPANCTCSKTFDQTTRYINCDNLNLTEVPGTEMGWATNVSLAHNDLRHLDAEALSVLSHGCPEYLYLQNNSIESIGRNTFRDLGCLKVLRLDHNFLTHLDSDTFAGLNLLVELQLQGNLIKSFHNETFLQLRRLEKLFLHDNQLVTVSSPQIITPPTGSLNQLTLAGNPWDCKCSFAPEFRQWIIEHMDIVVDLIDIQCILHETTSVLQKIGNLTQSMVESDNNRTKLLDIDAVSSLFPDKSELLPNKSVLMINESVFQAKLAIFNIENFCYLLENLTVVYGPTRFRTTGFSLQQRNVLISGMVLLALITITSAMVYRHRMAIKVWLFTRYGWRPFYNKKEDYGKMYDAYVSYSDKQLNFVLHELLPKLEQDMPHHKLFLRARDLIPGGVTANDIITAIEDSCRTIVVLSENYVQDEWCVFEFQRAHYNALHTKTHNVIVVLMHEVPSDTADKEIQLYLKTGSYFKRDDKKLWEKVRYALPDNRNREKHQNIIQLNAQVNQGGGDDINAWQNVENNQRNDAMQNADNQFNNDVFRLGSVESIVGKKNLKVNNVDRTENKLSTGDEEEYVNVEI